jgi:hypothetical protein
VGNRGGFSQLFRFDAQVSLAPAAEVLQNALPNWKSGIFVAKVDSKHIRISLCMIDVLWGESEPWLT